MTRRILTAFLAALTLNAAAGEAATNTYTYSPQLTLLGLTPALQAGAYNGAGVVFGDIDTGITKQWIGFSSPGNTALASGATNIDIADSAQCLNGVCPIKSRMLNVFPADANGHGTFTASEIVGGLQNFGMASLDPAGKMIAVQVLSASGSGYSNDIYNGIVYAVNHGARVLNLSLGPSGSAAQQASFYKSIAGAVNYAASKGAVLVFAGGNAAQSFAGGANITGFTDQAIAHIILMGSTNAAKTLSTFSDTPGKAGFISSTGKFVAYDTVWMMADGENIWGASNYHTSAYGYSYITQMSGTSMAAPQGAGIAGLLTAKWPYLLARGTIPQIMEKSAADLGIKGVDATYGDGFINAAAAFQPIGPQSIPVNGAMVPLSGGISSGAALGDMGGVSRALSHASLYDSFGRDFPVNLGSSITTKSSSIALSAATIRVTGQGGAAARSFTQTGGNTWFSFSGDAGAQGRPDTTTSPGFIADPTRPSQNVWSMGFQQNDGTYVGAGQGPDAALSFNDARWGGKTAFFNSGDSIGGTLLGLTDTANYSSVGFDHGKDEHISLGVMSAAADDFTSLGGQQASAYGAAIGYTVRPSDKLTLSWTSSFLDEKNMLLGSPASGYLSLGQASTMSLGMGANMKLGGGLNLGLDTIVAATGPSRNQASLIAGTSRLYSAGFSVALNKQNLTGADDNLAVSIKKPLRVYGGSADVDVPSGTDGNGNPIVRGIRTGLAPSGNETDLGLDYMRPFAGRGSASFSMAYRNDADNIAGARDAAAMVHYRLRF
jgi:hypothetical protein